MASHVSFEGSVNHGSQIGINKGKVQNYFNTYERPKTPPEPVNKVPFSRDPDFIEPGDLLGQIDQRCSNNTAKLALVGLGGVGKSQLAVEYIYRTREKHPATWVFWIHASNASRFEQSYREIAEVAKIPGRKDANVNVMSLVSAWFQDTRRRWLLVVDNVDDHQYLFEQRHSDQGKGDTQPLISFLPQSSDGTIIITTRNKAIAMDLAFERDCIAVEPMTSPQASSLLDKKLNTRVKSQATKDEIIKLAETLEFMPLALIQAAAYLNKRASLTSVAKYLRAFGESDNRRIKLLAYEAGKIYRDWEAKNAILVTWQLSFDEIQSKHSAAADLLSLMSFFDKSGIPKSVLHIPGPSKSNDDEDDNDSVDSDEFVDNLTILIDYSFVSVSPDSEFLEMHRLVQLATRKWLMSQGRSELWQSQFITCLKDAFPSERADEEYHSVCRPLFPHVQAAVLQRPSSKDSLKTWATVLYDAGRYAKNEAIFNPMLNMAMEAMEACVQQLGPTSEESFDNTRVATDALMCIGRYDEAEKIIRRLIQHFRDEHGLESGYTLSAMRDLSWVYCYDERLPEVISLGDEVVKTFKQLIGVNNEISFVAINDLAHFHAQNGNTLKSIELLTEVVSRSKAILGPSHLGTLDYMNRLAEMYGDLQQWNKARSLNAEAFEIQKSILKSESRQLFLVMQRMAHFEANVNKLTAAELLGTKAFEGLKKTLGLKHPSTVRALKTLALIRKMQGRLGEGIDIQQQSIELLKKLYGDESIYVKSATLTLESWRTDKVMGAAGAGRGQELEALLREGQDLSRHDLSWGRSALSEAAKNGQISMVKFLLEKGVDPNIQDVRVKNSRQNNTGKTPLMWASMLDQLDVCVVLLENGAETSLVDVYGRTALSWASEYGHEKVVETLLQKDTCLNVRDCFRGQTPLSWASMNGHLHVAEALLGHGADPYCADQDGKFPASWAEERGHRQIGHICRRKEKGQDNLLGDGVVMSLLQT